MVEIPATRVNGTNYFMTEKVYLYGATPDGAWVSYMHKDKAYMKPSDDTDITDEEFAEFSSMPEDDSDRPEKVVATMNGKVITDNSTVSAGYLKFETATEGAKILYYTTNGNCPIADTENRIEYKRPIYLEAGKQTVRKSPLLLRLTLHSQRQQAQNPKVCTVLKERSSGLTTPARSSARTARLSCPTSPKRGIMW